MPHRQGPLERRDRVGGLAAFGQDHPPLEYHRGKIPVHRKHRVADGQGLRGLTLPTQARGLAVENIRLARGNAQRRVESLDRRVQPVVLLQHDALVQHRFDRTRIDRRRLVEAGGRARKVAQLGMDRAQPDMSVNQIRLQPDRPLQAGDRLLPPPQVLQDVPTVTMHERHVGLDVDRLVQQQQRVVVLPLGLLEQRPAMQRLMVPAVDADHTPVQLVGRPPPARVMVLDRRGQQLAFSRRRVQCSGCVHVAGPPRCNTRQAQPTQHGQAAASQTHKSQIAPPPPSTQQPLKTLRFIHPPASRPPPHRATKRAKHHRARRPTPASAKGRCTQSPPNTAVTPLVSPAAHSDPVAPSAPSALLPRTAPRVPRARSVATSRPASCPAAPQPSSAPAAARHQAHHRVLAQRQAVALDMPRAPEGMPSGA